jgi:hypothetical protein
MNTETPTNTEESFFKLFSSATTILRSAHLSRQDPWLTTTQLKAMRELVAPLRIVLRAVRCAVGKRKFKQFKKRYAKETSLI